jgi:dolichyl-phosphate beta-glucosyltransferase
LPGSSPYLSIVIPAYNEAGAIQAGKLARVTEWLAEQEYSSELIVVDDGSQDGTAELAEAKGVRVERIQHAGKAAAIVAGIQAARGRDRSVYRYGSGHTHQRNAEAAAID